MTKYDRYEVGSLVDLLRGWSAQSRILHSFYSMAVGLILGILVIVALTTFTFETDGSYELPGIIAMSLLVAMMVSMAWSLIAVWMVPYRAEDEERAGYTTLRLRKTSLPLVDHRTGAVLRPAGAQQLSRAETKAIRRELLTAAPDAQLTRTRVARAVLEHDGEGSEEPEAKPTEQRTLPADALLEVRQVRAFRVGVVLLGLPVLLIGVQFFLLTRRGAGEPLVPALWTLGVALLLLLLMVWIFSGFARRVERRMSVLRQNEPTSDVFAVATGVLGLKEWIEKKDPMLAVGNYSIVVADGAGLWFLSSQSNRRAGVCWTDIEAVSVVQVPERFFHRRALRVSTAEGSVDLAPYGGRGAFGLRPASDASAASLLALLRDQARAHTVPRSRL